MLDMGFEPQVSEIIRGSGMPPPAPMVGGQRDMAVGRQNLMFSATFPPNVQRLAAALVMGSGSAGNMGLGGGRAPPPAKVAVGRVGQGGCFSASTPPTLKLLLLIRPSA
jgi:superfamily II DNA/RNA helicase